ncbi:MarR family winged helix-turn-helix transcriptional regulator [Sinomonas sp. G460-2]|uniref:MarR family winged helix-turn-helix transcriptional regulator n=1 Tax=Sinomonas sp. G460-2 TaxID=3393464 RepID=UPI0039EF55D0
MTEENDRKAGRRGLRDGEGTAPGGAEADVEAVLRASRALLGVVASSVADALETVTLPQFRVLVVLASSGSTAIGALAARLGAVASTFSRFIDRMEDGGFVERAPSPDSRREILVRITPKGTDIVYGATQQRRESIARILRRLGREERASIVAGLETFSAAAGEPSPETLLTLGL